MDSAQRKYMMLTATATKIKFWERSISRELINRNLRSYRDWWNSRWICDSPAIPWMKRRKYPNHSIKLDELKPGKSKKTSASTKPWSFTIPRYAFTHQGKTEKTIFPFEYFDGSIANRKGKIDPELPEQWRLQGFPYFFESRRRGFKPHSQPIMFIVDPWWNPAVEQQAIDRTHRIGPDKNILPTGWSA